MIVEVYNDYDYKVMYFLSDYEPCSINCLT